MFGAWHITLRLWSGHMDGIDSAIAFLLAPQAPTWSTKPCPKAWKKPEDSTVRDRKLKMDFVLEATFFSTTLLYARVTPGATGTR